MEKCRAPLSAKATGCIMFKALLWASVGASLIKFAPAKRVLPGDQFVGIQDKRSVQEHARSLSKKQEDEDVSEL